MSVDQDSDDDDECYDTHDDTDDVGIATADDCYDYSYDVAEIMDT